MKKAIAGFILFFAAFTTAAFAEAELKFYGQQWLRYEYGFSGAEPAANSFYVPRTYLRLKVRDFDMGYEGHLTLDLNNDRYGQKVATTSTAGAVDWGVWLKYGYVSFKKIPVLSGADISLQAGVLPVYFGIVGTWPYPVIEKAPEDRYGYIGSADQGVALAGVLPEGWGSYELAVYNGSGVKKMEDNMEKAYLANLHVSPIQEIYARVSYYRTLTGALNSSAERFDATAAVLGFKITDVEGFFEYVVKNSARDRTAGKSGVAEIYSVFASYTFLNDFSALARYDMWDPDTFAIHDEMNTVIAGLNVKIAGEFALLQLNYQLDTPKFKGTGIKNENLWLAQLKWNW